MTVAPIDPRQADAPDSTARSTVTLGRPRPERRNADDARGLARPAAIGDGLPARSAWVVVAARRPFLLRGHRPAIVHGRAFPGGEARKPPTRLRAVDSGQPGGLRGA